MSANDATDIYGELEVRRLWLRWSCFFTSPLQQPLETLTHEVDANTGDKRSRQEAEEEIDAPAVGNQVPTYTSPQAQTPNDYSAMEGIATGGMDSLYIGDLQWVSHVLGHICTRLS